jgi:hypothetical protein
MKLRDMVSTVVFLALAALPPVFADASTTPAEPSETWECPQADGTSVYTNKEKTGCRAMPLKSLSVVPSLDNMPLIPRHIGVPSPSVHIPGYSDYPTGAHAQHVPDWAKDWYASTTGSRGDICGMYWEWIRLNEKTRGGLFFGSDPSYGGDTTGRNQRGPSYSFYDNARYIALNRIFGTGFIPVGCQ